MTEVSEVIDIAEAATVLGRSQSALRMQVHRKMNLGQEIDLPQPFMLLGRWVWNRVRFRQWLEEKGAGQAQD